MSSSPVEVGGWSALADGGTGRSLRRLDRAGNVSRRRRGRQFVSSFVLAQPVGTSAAPTPTARSSRRLRATLSTPV
ncbi:hypothetical protein BRD18_04640 [Halobacteriales archaeon SW_7_71_33]|nr:MAG: hypothetical protein BRD18_04640 [Halobacteriales archaeon SW_7_71_33]